MVSIDDFKEVRECDYKNEHYSVRDNGAILRHSRLNKQKRKDDEAWTFGKPNEKTGYMNFSNETVHRIVAFAFLGAPPTDQHVVDHIDTNRRNNRPDNLRWLTKLENVLNNKITVAKIERLIGSIEVFLADPSVLKGYEDKDPNFGWMRTVTSAEARVSYERLNSWSQERTELKGGKIGEWIFNKPQYPDNTLRNMGNNIESDEVQSLTPHAIQTNWKIPCEFPFCPTEISDTPIADYKDKLEIGKPFCKNDQYTSLVLKSVITDNGAALLVMCKSASDSTKPWTLAKVIFCEDVFVHENIRSFFREDGAQKHFTLAQGLEWTGGEVFDDLC